MSKEELITSFEFIGQQPSNAIVERCLEICSKYEVDVEELVEHWSAFSMTYLKDAAISLEGVSSMEQRIFSSKQPKAVSQEISTNTTQQEDKIYKKSINEPEEYEGINTTSHNLDYGNDLNGSSRIESIDQQIDEEGSSNTQSNYKDRTCSENVVASFGHNYHCMAGEHSPNIIINENSEWHKPQHFTALCTTQARIANCFNTRISSLGQILLKRNNLEGSHTEGNAIIYGRVKSEDGNKVNNKNIILETSSDFIGPREIVLNISNTESYSIFSGQIIAAKGIIVSKNLIVQEIYNNASPEFLPESSSLEENLKIMVAAGPFTLSDNLLYEPLQDLLKRVTEQRPNVLILIGPFIDAAHSKISDITETFEEYFEILIKNIMDCLVEMPIQVVLVPSVNDTHHFPCYPTPSYVLKDYTNIKCAPNPALLEINGFVIGVTSLDILFQLTKEEISRNIGRDRMTRLAAHILHQRSFFPLYPDRDSSLCIDYEQLLNDCNIDIKPHLLILPSTLRYFIKKVDNCLVVNPERLVKNHVGGTYAIINVSPSLKAGNMVDCISCQIKNI